MTTTPIHDALVRERAGEEARALVRRSFLACPTCGAAYNAPCRTARGNIANPPHKARPWRGQP